MYVHALTTSSGQSVLNCMSLSVRQTIRLLLIISSLFITEKIYFPLEGLAEWGPRRIEY